jgi:hypothetical protein
MHLSDSHCEYEDLRHWPIHRAIRWLVQKTISPT